MRAVALIISVWFVSAAARSEQLVTDTTWKVYRSPLTTCNGQPCFYPPPDGWLTTTYDDSTWAQATDEGAYGQPLGSGSSGYGVPAGSAARWIWSLDTRHLQSAEQSVTSFRKHFTTTSGQLTIQAGYFGAGGAGIPFYGSAYPECLLFIDGAFFGNCGDPVAITGLASGSDHVIAAQIMCDTPSPYYACGLIASGDYYQPVLSSTPVCFASGNYSVNAQACPYKGETQLVGDADSYANHWYSATGIRDVTGTVAAGGCGGAILACAQGTCNHPNVSPVDDEVFGNHQDRDFEFYLLPDDSSLLSAANLVGGGDNAPGGMFIENEWMYQYPVLKSKDWAIPLGPTLGSTGWGAPWRGDSVAIRGRHILDCGHVDDIGEARTEIHPPIVVAWLHPQDNPDSNPHHSGIVWFHASSHFPDPVSPQAPFGAPFTATFSVPGGAIAGQPLYVSSVSLDWQVDPIADSLQWPPCDDGSSWPEEPWKHFCPTGSTGMDTNATTVARLNQALWNIQTQANPSAGTVTLTLSPSYDPASPIPSLVGGHFTVCMPECTIEGVSQNGCPGTCNARVHGAFEAAYYKTTGGTAFPPNQTTLLHVKGWIVDTQPGQTQNVQWVNVTTDTSSPNSAITPHIARPDVAAMFNNQDYLYSGFEGDVTLPTGYQSSTNLHVIAALYDGTTYQMTQTRSITFGNCSYYGNCPADQACPSSTFLCSTSCAPNPAISFTEGKCNGGCCDSASHTCVAGNTTQDCGSSGDWCGSCSAGYSCSNGSCYQCNASTCPNGCCSNNTCYTSSTSNGCVTGGQACASACTAGYICSGGACAYQCNATTCPSGSGSVCYNNSCCTPSCPALGCGQTASNGCGGTCHGTSCRSGYTCGKCDPGVCYLTSAQCR